MINILIVEDDDDIRELLKINCEKDGYKVFTADNGFDALEILKTEDIKLAILDIMLPKLNGYELIQKLRKFSKIPVIFLSAKSEEIHKIRGLSLGADDYVTKPFGMGEISFRIQSHLRRFLDYSKENYEEPGNYLLTNGSLKLNKKTCEVFVKNKLVDLSVKEYKILELFLTNLEFVFTKKQIYEKIWREDFFGDDNTVMVHISNLRNKIESNPKNPLYLITIKGLGYKMVKSE